MSSPNPEHLQSSLSIDGMYANYFLDYASYVILERAVPHICDGLKPVQRRILHAMERIDDGRYNKVANITGDTMKYHPHGNASIDEAIVTLGQKGFLIDPQGNWGNIYTGDSAAASRYIEARLSKFAKEVVYSAKVTTWQLSYDGRNKEPVTLPVKFPLLLAQGAEGIAVGLACKILPHNFNELVSAAISALKNEPFELVPDFPTGGIMDPADYRDGLRGGRIRVRARILVESNKLLRITEVPFGTTTNSLMESIVAASEKGSIKIAKIEDNTASKVDILVHLPLGVDPAQTEQALYAFTDCETSISPNSCVILDNKPLFLGATEILRYSAQKTREILGQELEVDLAETQEKWHFASLEKIFIEQKIYRDIEECETWEAVLQAIFDGLKPFTQNLLREVTQDDVAALTEIKIKRISKFDSSKANENLRELEEEIEKVKKNLGQLTAFTIKHFERIKKTYGTTFPRMTEITAFDQINRAQVAVANETLYLDKENGFAGWGLKKETPVEKCSPLDDVIVISAEGKLRVMKIAEKMFVGKKPLHLAVFRKEEDPIFNVIYRDGREGTTLAKRFRIGGITREKEYDLISTTPGSKILYFKVYATEEESTADIVLINLKAALRLRNLSRPFAFSELGIKNRGSRGNVVTKHAVSSIVKGRPNS